MTVPLLPFWGVTYQVNILGVPPFGVITVQNTVGPPGTVGPGHGLFTTWDVRKEWGPENDSATISIANLDLPFRKALSAALNLPLPLEVQLLVGWGGFPELLFQGKSRKTNPDARERTDVMTVFELTDGGVEARATPPSGGADLAAAIRVVVAKLVLQLGYRPGGPALGAVEAAATVAQIPSFQEVYNEGPRDKLDKLMASLDLSWGVEAGFFIVYRKGVRDDILPGLLTPNHGLLSWSERDDGGIDFFALGQSRFAPGMALTIQDEKDVIVGGGQLRLDSVQFTGSNETTYTMTGVAKKLVTTG